MRLLVVVPLLTAVGCGYGFNPTKPAAATDRPVEAPLPSRAAQKRADGTPDQEAIQAALDLLKTKNAELFGRLKADAQPSAYKALAAEMGAAVKGHDLGVAPAEFKAVWERHRKAWKQLHGILAKLPDAYEDTEFSDAIGGLFKGDPTRGRSLGGDMVDAVKAVTKSHDDLYRSAENYGLEVER
jgi:hypothetical protein